MGLLVAGAGVLVVLIILVFAFSSSESTDTSTTVSNVQQEPRWHAGPLQSLPSIQAETRPDATGTVEGRKVRDAFEGYRRAILEQNGTRAVAFVDSKTIAYYQQMLNSTMSASRQQVKSQSLMNRMFILYCRHLYRLEELKQLDGKALFIDAVDKGMISKSTVIKHRIGKVWIQGKTASSQMFSDDREMKIQFQYRQEDNAWKLDLTAALPLANLAMKTLIQMQEMDEDEFIVSAIESISGRKVDNAVWDPPR